MEGESKLQVHLSGFMKTAAMLLLLNLMLSLQSAVYAEEEVDLQVEAEFSGVAYQNGQLKVSVWRENFAAVLEEIAQKVDIAITTKYPANERITKTFDYQPLEKGLKNFLEGKNYIFLYRSEENEQPPKLIRIVVLSESRKRTKTTIAAKEPGSIPDPALETIKQGLSETFAVNKESLTQEIGKVMKSSLDQEGTGDATLSENELSSEEISEIVEKAFDGIQNEMAKKIIEKNSQNLPKASVQE